MPISHKITHIRSELLDKLMIVELLSVAMSIHAAAFLPDRNTGAMEFRSSSAR